MTRPRSPRGRKQKGDAAEGRVKRALQDLGYTVVDGRMTEPGLDLIAWESPSARPWCIEVKARGEVYDLGPDDKRSIFGRDQWCLTRGWRYNLIFVRNAEPLVGLVLRIDGLVVSEKRKGLSLMVYEQSRLALPARPTPLPWEFSGTPSAPAAKRPIANSNDAFLRAQEYAAKYPSPRPIWEE